MFIGSEGENISQSHGHVANNEYLIGRCTYCFHLGLVAYILAIVVWCIGSLPTRTAVIAVTIFALGAGQLCSTLYQMGA